MVVSMQNVIPVGADDVAGAAVQKALEFAARKTGCSRRSAVVSNLTTRDEWALGYLAYGLARNVASSLAELDDNVREAYVLGLEGDGCGSTSFPVVLVLSVTRQTAALESIVAGVLKALPRALAERAALSSELSVGFVDIQVIETEDIGKKRGLGAAIRSLWAPALKVWSR